MEAAIERLDEEIKHIDSLIEENSSDYKRLEELMEERRKLVHEVDLLYKNWMEL